MEQRRFILFLTLSMAFVLAWTGFISPLFWPPPERPAAEPGVAEVEQPDEPAADEDDEVEPAPDVPGGEPVADAAQPAGGDEAELAEDPAPKADEEVQPAGLPQHPARIVFLGSLDEDSPYFLQATLTTKGAAIQSIELNDPRYKELDDPTAPLKVINSSPALGLRTLATSVPAIDDQLKMATLETVNWEVVPGSESESGVTFRIVSPDGRVEVVKRYELQPVEEDERSDVRDAATPGYEIVLKQTIRNLSAEQQTLEYTLQGPTGLPLENTENTSKYRDVRLAFVDAEGSLDQSSLSAKEVVDSVEDDKHVTWQRPLKYIGIDVQYFAALLMPLNNEAEEQTIASAAPIVLHRDARKEFSDISVVLSSAEIDLPPGKSQTDEYLLYAGPKRQVLLEPLGASSIVDLGWFAVISEGMLWLLNGLRAAGINYGIAIVLLTVLVRGALFPLSRKQAANVQKMKELQPKLQELRKKHENDKEGMAKAQMELFSKHNYNPFSGCLTLFLQMPIFFGLYRALNSSVDLRRASFLWIDNLAAPDALFPLGFTVPFLGWTEFNLLPILTIGLFILQQKIYMPPAADKEQELQQKMMSYMMIFFGVMFYRVPAGLCVYFIASSLWGLAERKLLDIIKARSPAPPAVVEAERKPAKPSKLAQLWEQLQAAADVNTKNGSAGAAKKSGKSDRKKPKSRPRR